MIDKFFNINFDRVRASKYVLVEYECMKHITSLFDNVHIDINPKNNRETYVLSNKNEPKINYQMQSQVRNTLLSSDLVYLNFPISFFIENIRGTPHGYFNYEAIKEAIKELDQEEWTNQKLFDKIQEYNKKYPETIQDTLPKTHPEYENEQFKVKAWNDQFYLQQYWSFKKYGQLGAPLIDRPYNFFLGSAHSLFAAHLAKKEQMSIFIQVPEGGKGPKTEWCFQMPPALFDNKITYRFYINLEKKELWGIQTDPILLEQNHIQRYHKDINLTNYTKLL